MREAIVALRQRAAFLSVMTPKEYAASPAPRNPRASDCEHAARMLETIAENAGALKLAIETIEYESGRYHERAEAENNEEVGWEAGRPSAAEEAHSLDCALAILRAAERSA